jgi:hypothetical protein
MNYKIKIITGFRKEHEHSIPAEEAHKAYYLFLHPNERGIFSDGLALRGDDIRQILPDYVGTMGWNQAHQLDTNDWNELENKGVPQKLQKYLSLGKEVARTTQDPKELNTPLPTLVKAKYPQLLESKNRITGTSHIADKLPKTH